MMAMIIVIMVVVMVTITTMFMINGDDEVINVKVTRLRPCMDNNDDSVCCGYDNIMCSYCDNDYDTR